MYPYDPVPALAELAKALMESEGCSIHEAVDMALLQYDDRRAALPEFRRLVLIATDKL